MVNYQNNTVVLNFSSTDNGGAGEASYKFHMNLNKIGFESFLFVARKTKKNKKIFNVKNNLIYKLQSKISQIKNYLNITSIDYSFLDSDTSAEGTGGASIAHNFAFLSDGNPQFNSPDTQQNNSSENNVKDQLTQNMEIMMSQRDKEVPGAVQRF